MSGIPPNQCYICYQFYNNERIPLILTTCGHTYCKECLLLVLNRETKEIICPECKQVTQMNDNEISNLPKNRSLLNLIIYNEQINYNEKSKKEKRKIDKNSENITDKSIKNKITLEKYFEKYNEVLSKLEETYKSILNEHSYLNEISEILIMKEIDDVLDNFIEVINDHRFNLQKRIRAEFEKVNLIKDFCNSISTLRNRLNNYMKFYNIDFDKTENDNRITNNENLNEEPQVFRNSQSSLNKLLIENKKIILNNPNNISNNTIHNLNEDNINEHKSSIYENNDYLKNEIVLDNMIQKPENMDNLNEIQLKIHEELNLNLQNKNQNESIHNYQVKETNENSSKKIINNFETIYPISIHNSNNNVNNFNITKQKINNLDVLSFKEIINSEDFQNLENEIKYSELYYLTLKSFSKEIYNPCKFFYVNKFQIEKLCHDLKKMLFKACDFDENVIKFKIQDLNNFDEKKFIKEIQEACQQSNNSKLKFLFSHFRINPNFIYSDVLDQITNQQGVNEHISANSIGIQMNNLNNNVNNNFYNINNVSSNHNTFSSLNIFDPISARRNVNNPNRGLSSRYNSNILNNSNVKDKVFNLYSFLKYFKDKNELNEIVKYLVDELDYLPMKIENESNFDLKLVRDFEWKIELGVI